MSLARVVNCPCCDCIEDGCCDECTECSACSTIDWDILITDVNQSDSQPSMSRTVTPCVATCSTCAKVSPTGCVKVRCANQTDQQIRVQFTFTVSGLSGLCGLSGQYNCTDPFVFSNGSQAWFYLIINPGSIVEATMDHFVSGAGCCDNGNVTINGFSYQSEENVEVTQGFCCDGLAGTGDNPGCDASVAGHTEADSCTPGVDDVYCLSLYPPGMCHEVYCDFCPLSSAWYIITDARCGLGGTCEWDGDFSCCVA